jgi:hypothetical protein
MVSPTIIDKSAFAELYLVVEALIILLREKRSGISTIQGFRSPSILKNIPTSGIHEEFEGPMLAAY